MTATYLSVWFPHLPTDRLKRSVRTSGRGAPGPEAGQENALATVAKIKGAQRIVAVDPAASRQAIRPGMTLADARALLPGLAVAEADPQGEAATLDAIGAWCSRYTPLVALDPPDGLVLDIGGAAHLFGGTAGLMDSLTGGLERQGFGVRCALAASPEAGWAFARFGEAGAVSPPLDHKAFERRAAALPLAALRLDPSLVQGLAQAGLRRVGDLIWRPRAPLAARFGTPLFTRLDALMGRLKTPISPRFDPPVFVAEQRFASPILQHEAVQGTLLALAERLCGLLDRQAKGARDLRASLFRVDGVVKIITAGTSRPLNRPEAIARLFRERLEAAGEDGLDTGYGFDLVRLAAQVVEPLPARQGDLVAEPDRLTRDEDLADLVDRLGARLGLRRVTRLRGEDTHLPEFAVTAVPAAFGHASPRKPALVAEAPSRPIRLFASPEPIEAIASVPDGPPFRFRWRRNTHEVAAIEGPERIAPEWWRSGAVDLTRDYFRAEDRHGRRFWLFREGLFATETASPRWYVHGLFG